MFRRSFRFRPGRFTRRVRKIARRSTGQILAKRVILSGLTIPDVTAADWDNPLQVGLISCQETIDEEEESDGTNVADVPLYSKLVGLKLQLTVLGATSTTNVYRWMLHKLPDGEELITDANRLAGNFHSSDDTNPMREFRKMCMAKGMVVTNPNTAVTRLNVFVKRSAMKRVSPLREGDIIRLDIAKDTAGTTSLLHGFGTLYVRANA